MFSRKLLTAFALVGLLALQAQASSITVFAQCGCTPIDKDNPNQVWTPVGGTRIIITLVMDDGKKVSLYGETGKDGYATIDLGNIDPSKVVSVDITGAKLAGTFPMQSFSPGNTVNDGELVVITLTSCTSISSTLDGSSTDTGIATLDSPATDSTLAPTTGTIAQ